MAARRKGADEPVLAHQNRSAHHSSEARRFMSLYHTSRDSKARRYGAREASWHQHLAAEAHRRMRASYEIVYERTNP